jgi:tripartite-type tricarboxylate transporter receptor subunit TctC
MLAGAFALLAACAHAQSAFPAKPIRIILPYAPGGSTSVIARLLSPKLTEIWGQQVIVDNRPGGNTIIGSEALVRSPPDGYTLLLVTSTHTINASVIKTPYDTIRDFAAVTTLARAPFGLVVHPALPVRNLREFIAFAKARPGQLDYASSGTGTSNHLATELLSMLAGIRMNHIPYKGGGPAIIDLMGGQVQVTFDNLPASIEFIRAGRLRPLAVTTATRSEALPDVPTIAQFVPGYEASAWFGLGAPKGTPPEIIQLLNKEVNAAVADPNVRARLVDMGGMMINGTPAEFGKIIVEETEKWAKVVKFSGAKAE